MTKIADECDDDESEHAGEVFAHFHSVNQHIQQAQIDDVAYCVDRYESNNLAERFAFFSKRKVFVPKIAVRNAKYCRNKLRERIMQSAEYAQRIHSVPDCGIDSAYNTEAYFFSFKQ